MKNEIEEIIESFIQVIDKEQYFDKSIELIDILKKKSSLCTSDVNKLIQVIDSIQNHDKYSTFGFLLLAEIYRLSQNFHGTRLLNHGKLLWNQIIKRDSLRFFSYLFDNIKMCFEKSMIETKAIATVDTTSKSKLNHIDVSKIKLEGCQCIEDMIYAIKERLNCLSKETSIKKYWWQDKMCLPINENDIPWPVIIVLLVGLVVCKNPFSPKLEEILIDDCNDLLTLCALEDSSYRCPTEDADDDFSSVTALIHRHQRFIVKTLSDLMTEYKVPRTQKEFDELWYNPPTEGGVKAGTYEACTISHENRAACATIARCANGVLTFTKYEALKGHVGLWLPMALRLLNVHDEIVRQNSLLLLHSILDRSLNIELKPFEVPLWQTLNLCAPLFNEQHTCFKPYLDVYAMTLCKLYPDTTDPMRMERLNEFIRYGMTHAMASEALRAPQFLEAAQKVLPQAGAAIAMSLMAWIEIICQSLESFNPINCIQGLRCLIIIMDMVPTRICIYTCDILCRLSIMYLTHVESGPPHDYNKFRSPLITSKEEWNLIFKHRLL
eukprot:GHVL01033944.1.p1 GENE.GHVL01033944.1~~GHVL01033944.1.p1  ORF type:complete len:551 (+),score=58.55 GHVL01033944.1:18-1670(+)